MIAEYSSFIPKGITILDWGCGPVMSACWFLTNRPDMNVLACAHGLRVWNCSPFWSEVNLQPTQMIHDWELPYQDRQMDAVIGKGTFEHVANEQQSLTELYRVLKPGGLLILTSIPARWSAVEFGNRVLGRDHHRWKYGVNEMKRLLLGCGFVVEWWAFRVTCPLAFPWLLWPSKLMERIPGLRHLTQNFAVVARRVEYGV